MQNMDHLLIKNKNQIRQDSEKETTQILNKADSSK